MSEMTVKFFNNATAFDKWLQQHHKSETELWIGFHKKASGKPSVTYAEALDAALCFGWIDGLRKNIDKDSYKIRFTPRKPSSIWSNVNVAHVERLKKEGRMQRAGLDAYERKDAKRTGIYAFENRPKTLAPEYEKRFRANKAAWAFFENQAPFYKRTLTFYVMSAKKEETQLRRLENLIASSAEGKRLGVIEAKPNRKDA